MLFLIWIFQIHEARTHAYGAVIREEFVRRAHLPNMGRKSCTLRAIK